MQGFAPLGGAPLGAPDPGSTPGGGGATLVDGARVTDTVAADIQNLSVQLVDGITAGDTLAPNWRANGLVADLIRALDSTYQGAQNYNPVPVAAGDGVRLSDAADIRTGQVVTIADAIQVADVLVPVWGVVVTDRLLLPNVLVGNGVYGLFGREAMRLAEKAALGVPVSAQDGLWLANLLSAQSAVRLVEALRLTESWQAGATINVAMVQAMRLGDSLATFFGASVTDALAVAELLVALRTTTASAADTTLLDDTTGSGGQLMVAVTAAEGIEIDPELAIQMLFEPTLVEGVEISAGWLEPDGSFTAWTMNTRTGAVSEYADFAFNSFAALGSRYVGAAADGLYELLGDTDDGDDIIASIAGGYMQFGGTQLSRLKEAYIAAQGDGHWVLKVLTGDGLTYVYEVDNRSMRNTKFHMGKGQRARYFAWELTSGGQDFDLDTLEFVPLVVQRRV